MVGAVGLVFLLSYLDLHREQARALDDFIAEQSSLARSVGATMTARLELVSRDLKSALELDADGRGDAALARVLARDVAYSELDVFGRPGETAHALRDARGDSPPSAAFVAPARDELRSRLVKDRFATVGIFGRDGALTGPHLRFFGQTDGARTAMLVVDVDQLFSDVRAALDATGAPVRWWMLDETGKRVQLGRQDGGQARTGPLDDLAGSNDVSGLFEAMGRGSEGATLVDRRAAASMGLGERLAVAGFSPVQLGGGVRWGVAIVTSASRVRDRARFTAWRLAATTGLASLLVGLFGVAVGRHQRREQRLSEALNLAAATAALRERSEKMIEVIPIGVLALDSQHNVVSANPYLMDRGVRPAAPLGEALPSATQDEIRLLQALVREATDTKQPRERIGLVLHLSRGERRDIDAYAIPLGRPLSDVDCFLVLHDRTEIRSLERNLVRAEKLATIGTLAAGVAHEMGTPLGIISGRAEQLLARIPEGEAAEATRKNIASILAQVDKVSTTIRQLLDFARVRPIETELISPAQAVHGAAALLEAHFRQAQVRLDLEVGPSVASVAADAGQLEQVLVNLMMNACDACPPHGQVWARAGVVGEQVAIEIVDDGAGIPQENLPKVVDPFFTTKKRGQGTGLGLSIAADIVKNHGGSLEIESAVGGGTTVRVLLPKAGTSSEARR